MVFSHIPVMGKESIEYLFPASGGIYVDGTLGGGGHSRLILDACLDCRVIGIDQDIEAINAAKKNLAMYSDRFQAVQDNFENIDLILSSLGVEKVNGILLDLGVSSFQLDTAKRGFSFVETEENLSQPLDMRMDQSQELSAFEVVNEYSEEELAQILKEYGEEPMARRIASMIVRERSKEPIRTIGQLLEVIRLATPPKYRYSRRRHWASKTFRAIRIEVNDELGVVERALPKMVSSLSVGGRLVIITFHSLEDRIVKHYFRSLAKEGEYKLLTKKPLSPTEKEVEENPRSQSAKIRAIERIA